MFCFGLTDDTVSLWVFALDNRSVECGVIYCRWNDGDVPQSVCVVAVSCEYFLAMFENLELIFVKKGEAAVVAEFPYG